MTDQMTSLRAKPLALSLATFFAIIYLACLALALIVPDRGLHAPWLQFFPGFSWTWFGALVGLIESIVYGLIAGALFAPIYNYFDDLQ
jgi:ABC-type polysaccharide/polyol phosphate export permease